MNLSPIDIAIIATVMALVILGVWKARSQTKSVADFLSANRCAGRYLLTVAQGMASFGAVSMVALWEKFYQGGFGSLFWGMMSMPIGLILALTGFVIYRYRQTRALTLAQFFEMRYSRSFRIFAGCLCFISGVLNYGIFPAVTGRFLIYFLDIPILSSTVLGVELNWTLGIVMAVVLGMALSITLTGGQIAVMISDFIQGQLTSICFLLMLAVLLWVMPWGDMVKVLKTAAPGESMLNPFDQSQLPEFNPTFFFMGLFLMIINHKLWQGNQGYNVSARSPHEAKMAGVLGEFRAMIQFILIPFAAIACWALLNGNLMPDAAAATHTQLDALAQSANPEVVKQLRTTLALKNLLPAGVFGLLTIVVIMAAVSTDSTYLHSWGSIFVQDVLRPIRQNLGKPALSSKSHLRALKVAIFAVAAFAWCFSMVFPLREYILMYFTITGIIFVGGGGAVMVGGLYWRRGTTSGAWTAMAVGAVAGFFGILINNVLWVAWIPGVKDAFPHTMWIQSLPAQFWFNGMQIGFFTSLLSLSCYVGVSLLSRDPGVDFDQLFHRGRYAIPENSEGATAAGTRWPTVAGWMRKFGITEDFTTGDKLIFAFKYFIFFWKWGVGFLGLTVSYFVFGGMRSDDAWATWWAIFFAVIGVIGVGTTVWFLIGGFRDLFAMFRLLRSIRRDSDDDGTVRERVVISGDPKAGL